MILFVHYLQTFSFSSSFSSFVRSFFSFFHSFISSFSILFRTFAPMIAILLSIVLLFAPLYLHAEGVDKASASPRVFQLPVNCDGRTVMVTFLRGKGQERHALVGCNTYGKPAIDTTTVGRIIIPDSITAPNGKRYWVKGISRHAFAYCSRVTEVVMPETMTDIGDQAFIGCTSLTQITLPRNLVVIYPAAFRDCPSLNLIRFRSRKAVAVYADIFDQSTIDKAILMIPAGTSDTFKNSLVWGLFRYRMEDYDL